MVFACGVSRAACMVSRAACMACRARACGMLACMVRGAARKCVRGAACRVCGFFEACVMYGVRVWRVACGVHGGGVHGLLACRVRACRVSACMVRGAACKRVRMRGLTCGVFEACVVHGVRVWRRVVSLLCGVAWR